MNRLTSEIGKCSEIIKGVKTMKFKITYKVCGMGFEAIADTISEAYEYAKAIIEAEKLSFPRQEETLSEYMDLLVQIKNGWTDAHINHIFRIEKI